MQRFASSIPKHPSNLVQRPERILALGFLIVITIGTILLLLPISSQTHESIGLRHALFTSTSAVCVTGLTTIDVGNTLSYFGQGILLVLIQVGGLGFMVFTTLIMVVFGKRISLRNRMLIKESMNQSTLSGMVRLSLWFFGLAMVLELIGACFLMTRMIPLYGVKLGIWYSIFHSVSAFCNAGFDLIGNYQSMIPFAKDPVVVLTLTALIVLGGLGFSVLLECIHFRFRMKRMSLHTKIVLYTTAVLIVGCTLLIFLLESNNPHTMGDGNLNFGEKCLNSLFQAVTFRTAGFCTIDQASLTDTSKLIGIFAMFIGASPVSTGGGIKTTTIALVFFMVVAVVRGRESIQVFKKQISVGTVRRAIAIAFIALMLILVFTCIISVVETDKNYNVEDILFETTSAFSTTGLSSINTPTLSSVSQWLLMPLMFFGRVGPLTMALALAQRLENKVANRVHYPEEKIIIG